jgi:hypothetical protein
VASPIQDHRAHRNPYTVEWELDEAGERELNGTDGGAESGAAD